MSKQRDWVDYANLASNVAQNLQLHDVQKKLGTIQALAWQGELRESKRAAREREKDAATEREHHLREALFQGQLTLEDLQQSVQSAPRAVLALALEGRQFFDATGVSPGNFTEYEDKERANALLKGFEAVMEKAASVLSPEEQAQAGLCVKYRSEHRDLEDYIELKKAEESAQPRRDQLQAKRGELTKVVDELQRLPSAPISREELGLAVFVTSLILFGVFMWSWMEFNVPIGFAVVSLVTAPAGLILPRVLPGGMESAAVELRRSELLKTKSCLESESLRLADECNLGLLAERSKELEGKFGRHHSVRELEDMLCERNTLEMEVLYGYGGEDDDDMEIFTA